MGNLFLGLLGGNVAFRTQCLEKIYFKGKWTKRGLTALMSYKVTSDKANLGFQLLGHVISLADIWDVYFLHIFLCPKAKRF